MGGLGKAASGLEKITGRPSNVGAIAAGSTLAILMFVTVVNVTLRYVFGRPIAGAYELCEFMMALVVFLAFAYTAVTKSNIVVDLVVSRFPQEVRGVIEPILNLASLFFFSLISWRTFVFALSLKQTGEHSGTLHIPLFPFALLLSLACALLCLVLLKDLLASLGQAVMVSRWQAKVWLAIGTVPFLLTVMVLLWGDALPIQLSPEVAGLIGIGFLFILLFLGMPIGFTMGFVGLLGVAFLRGSGAGLDVLGRVTYGTVANYDLSVIPLFIIMGQFAFHSGLSRDLYYAVYNWLGHLPGGLAMATTGACAGFGAVTGSSLATAATMGTVAYPEMQRYKYDNGLAAACIAAGGPLAAMIPPSIVMVLYAITTDQSIGRLFIAGIVPGVMIAVLMMVTTYLMVSVNPRLGPRGPKSSLKEKLFSLKSTWGVSLLFLLVIGGIYAGVFTPVEAAGVGAFGALAFALFRRGLSWRAFTSSLIGTVETTAMVFIIVIGAMILGYFLAASKLTFFLGDFALGLPLPPVIVLIAVLIIYLVLGTFMQTVAMVLLTVPIFFPVVTALGFDPIWFGVMVVLLCEIGLITPPVGMVVYVLKGVVKDVSAGTIFRSVVPYVVALIVAAAILIALPQIATFLPDLMKG